MFKAKIVSLFMVPAVAVYSIAAGFFYRGTNAILLDLEALKTTAVMSLLCALAQDIIPRSFKEAVVFLRIRDRIPGYRAFKKQRTDRYDLSKITNRETLAGASGAEQQRVFYEVYKKHRGDPTVAQYSFRYCAWRDTAALFLCLAILTTPAAYAISNFGPAFTWKPAILLSASAAVAYVLTALAARQAANGLVGQVLSCETAEPPHGIYS